LYVVLRDTVSQNKLSDVDLEYRWTGKTTTIINNVDNSVHYSKYISAGLSFPLKDPKYFEIESVYTGKKGYLGVGYIPELKSFSAKIGVNIFKFQK
jgi:hypothetical protein